MEAQIRQSIEDNLFHREYRMSYASFNKLCSTLESDLRAKDYAWRTRKADLPPVIQVVVALRFLAGASYLDLMRRSGLGKASVYKCIWNVVDAIIENKDIGYALFPQTETQCKQKADQWAAISGVPGTSGVIKTAVGMMDGILIRIKVPSKRETNQAEDFRSGHKKAYGVNVQAVCDADLRFLFVSCMTPGKTNDLKAYKKSYLSELVSRLPAGFFVGGDAAYVNGEHVLVPFPGANLDQRKDTFNFFLSQLRIRVEMAFGLLVSRWGVLWRPLKVSLRRVPSLLLCLFRLHNFCTDEKEPTMQQPPSGIAQPEETTLVVHPEYDGVSVLQGQRGIFATRYQFQRSVEGGVGLRDFIADEIYEQNLTRPAHNLTRNAGRRRTNER